MARRSDDALQRRALSAISALLVVIVVVPYSWGPIFNIVHISIGSTAFTLALFVSARAMVHVWRRESPRSAAALRVSAALVVEASAWTVSTYWIFTVNGHLIWAQTVFLLAFLASAARWPGSRSPHHLGPSSAQLATAVVQ